MQQKVGLIPSGFCLAELKLSLLFNTSPSAQCLSADLGRQTGVQWGHWECTEGTSPALQLCTELGCRMMVLGVFLSLSSPVHGMTWRTKGASGNPAVPCKGLQGLTLVWLGSAVDLMDGIFFFLEIRSSDLHRVFGSWPRVSRGAGSPMHSCTA